MAEPPSRSRDRVERNEAQDQNHPRINPQHPAPNVVNPVGRFHRFDPSAYLTPPSFLSTFNPFLTQFSFKKELKSSDVGPAKRIVIPKALAERYLPHLDQSDGIIIYMTDMDTYGLWEFKFRFWNNNGSRMFILERTGDFVRAHGLQAGDFIMIYQDVQSGRLGIRGRKILLPPVVSPQVEMMSALGNYNILDGRAANVNTIARDPDPMTGGYFQLQPPIYGNNNNNINVIDGGVQMINNISPAAVVGGGGEVALPPLPPSLPPPPPSPPPPPPPATQADPVAFDPLTGFPPPESSSTSAGPDESADDWLSFLHAAIR